MLIKFEVKIELSVISILCLLFERSEQVSDVISGECRLAKDTHDFNDWPANFKIMLDNCDEAVCDDGNVYLYAHSILRLTPETLDLKMLLDPLEEQLHLPPILVEQSDVLCTKEEVIRVVNETAMQFWSIVDNSSDNAWVFLLIFLLGKADTLVFKHIVSAVENTFAIDNLVCWLTFLPDDEESSEYMDSIESGKVKVAPVKDIAGKRLVCEPVHRVDIMHLGIGNPVEHRNLRDDVNLRVDSDARLGASKLSPSKHGHAKVDGSGVNGIEPAVQLKFLRDTFGLSNCHHVEGKLLEDMVVSEKIGLREHLPVDRLVSKAQVFGLLTMGGCNICKFPESPTAHQLTEHQNQHVIPMRHRPALGPVVVLGKDAPELPLWEELGYLCKNVLSNMHICSDFESDAKVRISKPGQGIGELKRCA